MGVRDVAQANAERIERIGRAERRGLARRPGRPKKTDVDTWAPAERIYTPEELLHLLLTELTVSPVIAGQALGVARTKSYTACQADEIENFKVGRQRRVPTSWLRERLGIPHPY